MTATGEDLRARLLAHIRSSRLFPQPGVALLAVSGGVDSVALLDLMASLAPDLELGLAVAHVDHGISAEASAAAPRVSEWAGRYSLPCHVEKLQLGAAASETAARNERYRALRRMQAQVGARYLVTAHQADDQAETVLYRLLRGSGVFGLAAIPQVGPRGLVRPLLPFSRRELAEWLEQRFPDPGSRPILFDDPANADQRHDRVWVRQVIMPVLRDRLGPDLERTLARTAADARADRRAWAAWLRAVPELEFRREAGRVEVARAPLARYHKTLSEGLLRALAREVNCVLGPKRARSLREFVLRSTSGRRFQLGEGWEAELALGRLRIVSAGEQTLALDRSRAVAWGRGDEGCAWWPDWVFTWCTETAKETRRVAMTTWVTPGEGEIRVPEAGDRMVPLGGVGRRKVRRMLMEARIPARERQDYPVFVRGSDVLWIPGICRSAVAVPRVGQVAVRLDARVRTGR
ncbi:MAG: tRNA lysidine(34) synthetase TilS [Gemmatimonadota bacterium]|nr:MAG: tRNA lysidine(34) synthetase TilS [Gemmatimonadota bacterium]